MRRKCCHEFTCRLECGKVSSWTVTAKSPAAMLVIKNLAEEIVFNHISVHTFIHLGCLFAYRLTVSGSLRPVCQRRAPPGSEITTAARLNLRTGRGSSLWITTGLNESGAPWGFTLMGPEQQPNNYKHVFLCCRVPATLSPSARCTSS